MSPATEAWFLRQWHRNGSAQWVLRPVSWVFGLLVASRRLLYRCHLLPSARVDRPVIVVGNLSVGGTGKTPLVIALARLLKSAGRQPGIVTRGYRSAAGARGTVIHVVPDSDSTERYGDEALLLARRTGVPVLCGTDRAAAASELIARHPGVDIILSDDGLQHYALQRDVEIAVVDGARGFGNGALLPAGPLREPASRLASVDAIVINRTPVDGAARFDAGRTGTPSFAMTYGHETLAALAGGEILDVAQALQKFHGKRLAAMAGIGHPQRFFAHLARLGFAVTSLHPKPDHHDYRGADLAVPDADIVLVTEKDAVKLARFAIGGDLDRFWVLRIDAVLPDAFGEFLLGRLQTLLPRHVPRSEAA